MHAAGLTVVNQAQILGKVSALFATAVSDGMLDANPE
jgi:ribosomal 30S subunit maturation factor RimM